MNFAVIIRYAVLILSTALMVMGILVAVGLLVPRYFPEEYRVLLGVIVFLYGTYRFSVAYFRHPKE